MNTLEVNKPLDVCPEFPKPSDAVLLSLQVNHPDKQDPVWPWLDSVADLKDKLKKCHTELTN